MQTLFVCVAIIATSDAQESRLPAPKPSEIIGELVGEGRIQILGKNGSPIIKQVTDRDGAFLPEHATNPRNSQWSRWYGGTEFGYGPNRVSAIKIPSVFGQKEGAFRLFDQHVGDWVWVRILPLNRKEGENLRFRSHEGAIDETIRCARSLVQGSGKILDVGNRSKCLMAAMLPHKRFDEPRWANVLPLERKGDWVRGAIAGPSPCIPLRCMTPRTWNTTGLIVTRRLGIYGGQGRPAPKPLLFPIEGLWWQPRSHSFSRAIAAFAVKS